MQVQIQCGLGPGILISNQLLGDEAVAAGLATLL